MKNLLITRCLVLVALLLKAGLLYASEKKNDNLSQQLSQISNTLFKPLVSGLEPGFALGVYKEGKVIFTSSYGYRNLEERSLFTPEDKFYIASISKQFTAGILFQLVNEGKVHLNDNISKYLNDVPKSYESIKIKHLLYHTSGVREYTSLMLFRGDDINLQNQMNNQQVYKLLMNQDSLDFDPGTQFRYSSSGYVLLARLIEVIENKPFRIVAKEKIFDPLEMKDSHFNDDHSELITNRTISYKYSTNKKWKRWLKHFEVVGDGGVFTSVMDMAKWDEELSNGSRFGQNWKKMMQQKGKLKNGEEVNYAGAIQYTSINGFKVQWHGGGMGAYVSDFFRIPELRLSMVIFANRNDDNAFQGWKFVKRVTEIFHKSQEKLNAKNNPKIVNSKRALSKDYPGITGAYFISSKNNRFYIREDENGNFALHDSSNHLLDYLEGIDKNKLKTLTSGDELTFEEKDNKQIIKYISKKEQYSAYKYDDSLPLRVEDLSHLLGKYCSKELENWIEISSEGNKVFYQHAQGLKVELFPEPKDSRINWNSKSIVWVGYGMFEFDANTKEPSEYLFVGDFRVSGVEFRRCDNRSF